MATTSALILEIRAAKVAVFKNEELNKIILLADDSEQTIQSLIGEYKPHKSILSSVIDHNPAIEIILTAKTRFHKLSHLTKLAFTTPVGKPQTIGADRLALTAGAVHFYPGRNNLVISLGFVHYLQLSSINITN